MKNLAKKIYWLTKNAGVDPLKFFNFLRGGPFYFRDLNKFKNQEKQNKDKFGKICFHPSLEDRFAKSGEAKGHYFHQDLLAARRIFQNKSEKHVDVGSRIDGFVGHIAAFRPIEVMDIRTQTENIDNIRFIRSDLMGELKDEFIEYTDSLSCLHALEHFGLGRYGDPVAYDGHLLGWENLYRILKKGGKFYFSVPIGPQRVEFNSHRVFSLEYLLRICEGRYNIDFFSFVDDKGDLHENAVLEEASTKSNFGCRYGCGIFEMSKI